MSYQPNEEENQAASLLRKRGWRVIAPVEKESIKETGAYIIETSEGRLFIEGAEGIEDKIREDMKKSDKEVNSITFCQDGFFLE